jgi:hypothetical protein
MPQDQGLDVYLVPFGDMRERYRQHVVPTTSPSFAGDRNQIYIEAVDDERFVIVVDLLPEFDFQGYKHLRITYELDGASGKIGSATYRDFKDFRYERPRRSGLKGRYTLDSIIHKFDGSWSDCAFSFVSLTTGKNPFILRCVVIS